VSENSANEKPLQTTSFVIHATRGVIREQRTRRKMMLVVLVAALLLLVAGATFLAPALNPREHTGRFILFWAACAWLTFTAILLAIFDMLVVRRDARRAARELRERVDTPPATQSSIDQ
jgi:lysylphosphatidylglycerol synthetase-like protein (DUF2156 family)